MLRICRIVNSFTPESINGDLSPNYNYYTNISSQLGNEEIVICEKLPNQKEYEETSTGIKIFRIKTNSNHKLLSSTIGEFGRETLSLIKKLKPDIITGHNTAHFYLCKRHSELNIPLITQLHASVDMHKYTDKLPYIYNFKIALRDRFLEQIQFNLFKYVSNNCDTVITNSEYCKNSVLRYNPKQNIKVINNGIDTELFKPHINNHINPYIILLNISRPSPWKGLPYLLYSLYELRKKYPNIHLMQIGADRPDSQIYFNYIRSIIGKLNLNKNITFKKNIPYNEMPFSYSNADCFVLPSYPEPSGKTLFESQACNCPIVATDGGGTPEIFSPESGILFPPRNIPLLTSSIEEVINNPNKYKNGRNNIKKYTWNLCVKKLIKTYEEVI